MKDVPMLRLADCGLAVALDLLQVQDLQRGKQVLDLRPVMERIASVVPVVAHAEELSRD